MKTYQLILVIAVFGILFHLVSCGPNSSDNGKEKVIFNGKVIASNAEIVNAKVKVNSDSIFTEKDGSFNIRVDASEGIYYVSVEKFGYGLYSRKFSKGFENKSIILTQGTVIEFDPSVDTILTDSNSNNSFMQSSLLELDTSLLFNIVPRVYDHTGKIIDLGYPDEVKGIFNYIREPISSRPGMSVGLSANSLVNSSSGNTPPSGTKLRAALTTVDFFNPDGMPGDFTVRFTGDSSLINSEKGILEFLKNQNKRKANNDSRNDQENRAFMESFGAGTIEITDGENKYQLAPGKTAYVKIPVYEIRKRLKEELPSSIPLLHYHEDDAVWEITGVGYLNDERDAYEGKVNHFSVVNFDMVKTGPSRCFKIRQMLINGANNNVAGILPSYRTHILVPPTATSTFGERTREIVELTGPGGCVDVNGTSLHGVTRLDFNIPYIVAVFSQSGSGATDTMDIAIVAPNSSIPSETAVTEAGDCSSATCVAGDNCDTNLNAIDLTNYASAQCNTCWLPDCVVIPFDNSGADISAIVGIPTDVAGEVRVEWVNNNPAITSFKVTVHDGGCNGTELANISNPSNPAAECASCSGPGSLYCNGGELTYNGISGSTVYFKLTVDYSTSDCTGSAMTSDDICSDPVVIP